MLMPSIFGEKRNLFDDLFDFDEFDDFDRQINKKLYGKHGRNLMKTDVKEKENEYEMIIDLPGFSKDEITVQLEDGYLTVMAAKGLDQDEKDEETGNYIRKERYAGATSRTFYVGEGLKQQDIKGKFEHGILTLLIPKTTPQIESSTKYIEIE